MIYAETEIKLKNGCTAVVRNARPEDAKQTIEYLRTVSGESPFLLREPDEVNFTVEKERAILQKQSGKSKRDHAHRLCKRRACRQLFAGVTR